MVQNYKSCPSAKGAQTTATNTLTVLIAIYTTVEGIKGDRGREILARC